VNSVAKGSNQRWPVFGSEKQIIVSLPAPQINRTRNLGADIQNIVA